MSTVDPTDADSIAVDSAVPAQDLTPEAQQALESRYGSGRRRKRDRKFAYGIVAGLIVAALGFFFFSGWQTASQVEWQDIGYTKRSELVLDVKFEVSAKANAEVACAVEALNTSKATIGWKVVELPVSPELIRTVTTKLVVTNPATAATVRHCWVIDRAEG